MISKPAADFIEKCDKISYRRILVKDHPCSLPDKCNDKLHLDCLGIMRFCHRDYFGKRVALKNKRNGINQECCCSRPVSNAHTLGFLAHFRLKTRLQRLPFKREKKRQWYVSWRRKSLKTTIKGMPIYKIEITVSQDTHTSG